MVESRGEKEKVEESECEEEVLVESQAKEKVECSDEMSEQTSPKEEPKAPLKGDLNAEMEDADTIYLDPEDEAKTVNLMGQTVTYRVWLKGLWKTFTEDEEDIMLERMYEVEKNADHIEGCMGGWFSPESRAEWSAASRPRMWRNTVRLWQT